ncbi:hypothetical protein KFL_001960060 [Klebsormidium nitens]|uniref:PLAC8 family protein n=1 Tax=Klebsormidium nitens TaxID=105231 RepID=A0A1Y1I596_KLENI|nr:hypothetical protein KFL_001960060 [Klebsormidium nitens]|eukprot:GAQ84589.1 hypothetical protein KFL_001960060 [Klebsormidium nitens]
MAENPKCPGQVVWVSSSEPLHQESSLPPLQEDSFDDLPELIEAESDSDSEGVPELVADLSEVSDYDDMPELGSDSDDDVSDDDEPPPLVGEDSDDEDDLPELIAFDDEEDSKEKYELLIATAGARRSSPYRSLTQQPCWLEKSAIGNLEGFGGGDVTSGESSPWNMALAQYQSKVGNPLVVITDSVGEETLSNESLRRPVECPRLGDQGLVKGEERTVVFPGGAKQAEPQEWSTGLFDCCLDVPTCLLGALCPCVLYGQTHRLVTGRSCMTSALAQFFAVLGGALLGGCFLCHWGYAPCAAAPLRSVIRGKYGLAATGPFELASEAEGRLADCFVHYWCHPCALCQEYREVKFRTKLETGGTYTAPPVVEEMEKRVIAEPVKSAGVKEEAGGVYYTLLAGEYKGAVV